MLSSKYIMIIFLKNLIITQKLIPLLFYFFSHQYISSVINFLDFINFLYLHPFSYNYNNL